jgi:hypothetical protein
MRCLVVALFGLASTAALAQTSGPAHVGAGQMPTTFAIPRGSVGCPVGFYASRQAVPQVTTAADAKKIGNAQGLHLILDHLAAPAIQSVRITVYAVPPTLRVLPLAPATDDVISKTFDLTRDTGTDSLREADVWMHEVGSVRWADLVSITFTDTTTWHPTGEVKCRAVPSNFVPVASR